MVRNSLSSLVLVAFLLTGCGAQPASVQTNTPPVVATGSTVTETPASPISNANDVFCTEEYAPVCAKRQVQCIKAPCDPVEQTYPNRCYAQKDGGFDIKEGACSLE